jgi:hypothetical protein
MDFTKLRRMGYATMVVEGAMAALAPRLSVKLNAKMWQVAFENVGELEPKPWYVRLTRAVGGGLVVAGLLGLLQEPVEPTEPAPAEESEADEPGERIEIE